MKYWALIRGNSYFNTAFLLFYFFIYNWLLFIKEDGIHKITLFLITFFTFLFCLILYRVSQLVFKLFLLFCSIVFIPFYIASEFVGGLTNAHFMALFLTDFAESNFYFKVIPKLLILKAVIFASLAFYFFNAKIFKVNKLIFAFFLTLIVFYMGFKFWRTRSDLKNNKIYAFKSVYISPFRVIVRCSVMYSEVKKELVKQKELMSVKDSWVNCSSTPNEEITVVIIGESVRKDFLGIYNPSMNTSPFLDSIPKIQFNNAISYAFQTLESLSSSLLLKDAEGMPYFPNNVVSLSKKSGFDVSWISNQGAIGVEDNFIAAMGKQADYYNFVSKGRWNEHVADNEMLNVLQERLEEKSITKPKVVFMHMIGSHPDPCDITNGEYREFIQSKSISCYIESIKRTDEFIKQIYQSLKKTNKKFNIVYFSDHGLYLDNNDKVYHRSDVKESYDVPFFVINSELKENTFVNEFRNLKDFLPFYLELMNIETSNLKKQYQFISDEKASGNPHILYENKDYRELKDNPIAE